MIKSFLKALTVVSVILSVAACDNESVFDEMSRIKRVGDTDPRLALSMLDSIECSVRDADDHTVNTFDLLKIRLNDKADNIPVSDISIQHVLSYYEEHGNSAELQEAYYYAGSVYRDLHDTPRALEYFFRSLDSADDAADECDSLMLRNTYSNLEYLYYLVQNYHDSALMAERELEVCLALGKNPVLPYMHLGSSMLAQDSLSKAESCFDYVFDYLSADMGTADHTDDYLYLMEYYSKMRRADKARRCYAHARVTEYDDKHPAFYDLAFAEYYSLIGETDSAIARCQRTFEHNPSIYNEYDAASLLLSFAIRKGDDQMSLRYAKSYLAISDSINLGRRQELSATVSNQYKYHLDKKKVERLNRDRERYYLMLIGAVLLMGVVTLSFVILSIVRKNHHLQQVINLSRRLESAESNSKTLEEHISAKEDEIRHHTTTLEQNQNELEKLKRQLAEVTDKLSQYNSDLQVAEQRLADKIDQNKSLLRLLHRSELEDKAEDIISSLRLSSNGIRRMTDVEWKKLYSAIDELYPDLRNRLAAEYGQFTEQQMQVCYLLRIGVSNTQISNLTDISRATVWRWANKFSHIIDD